MTFPRHESPATAPVAPTPPPAIRIDRLEVEGCGAISAAALREGFRDAWTRADHATRWSPASAELFRAPLTLDLPPGLGGRELGRRLAAAILARAGTSAPHR